MLSRLGTYRKDIQWICGILFVLTLAVALLVGGAARVAAPGSARPAVKAIVKDVLLKSDMAKNYEQTRQFLLSMPPDEPVEIPNFPKLGITAGEAAGMDAETLADRIAADISVQIYEGKLDLSSMGESGQGLASLAGIFSAGTFKALSTVSDGVWWGVAGLGLLMVVFSSRFGRLGSLGIGLTLGSLLPFLVYQAALAQLNARKPGAAAGAGTEQAIDTGVIIKALRPAAEAAAGFAGNFLTAGAGLIVVALTGAAIRAIVSRVRRPAPGPEILSEEAATPTA